MKTSMLVILLLSVAMIGCSTMSGSPPLNTPSPIPNPPYANDYTSGEALLPTGSYLFIEAYLHDEARGTCLYAPSAEQPPLLYHFRPDRKILEIDWRGLDVGLSGSFNQEQIIERALKTIGFFGQRKTESYSLGGATITGISAMQELPASGYFPYKATGSPVIVEAVDERGVAVVNIKGEAYFLEPGTSWQESEEYEPQTGCFVTRMITLTNYGLLPRDELLFE